MRLLISIIILLTVPFATVAQKSSIKFKQTSNYLGNIPQKEGEVKSIFSFTNSGNNPLTIFDIRTECDCITYEIDQQTIAPGQSADITIIFDPEQITGKFVKSIALFSNTNPSTSTLTIRGYVIPQEHGPFDNFPIKMGDIRLSSDSMDMQIVNRGIIRHKEIQVINASKTDVQVGAYIEAKNMELNVTPAQLKPLETAKIALKWTITDDTPLGPQNQEIIITQNGKESGKIYTFAEVHENFSKYKESNYDLAPTISIKDYEFDMGQLVCGTTTQHNITISNTGKSELKITKVICDDQNVSVQIKKGVKAGKNRKITVTIVANQEPSLRCAEIKLYTNDPKNPVVTYNLFYEIVQ